MKGRQFGRYRLLELLGQGGWAKSGARTTPTRTDSSRSRCFTGRRIRPMGANQAALQLGSTPRGGSLRSQSGVG
jgi:hypothetical protein